LKLSSQPEWESLNEMLEDNLQASYERLATITDIDEIRRTQGEIRYIKNFLKLREQIENLLRPA
jgi:hypothetical protein